MVKMHKFLTRSCKSQDFAQSQKNFARPHDRVTVTFRNFALPLKIVNIFNLKNLCLDILAHFSFKVKHILISVGSNSHMNAER